jgi:hypothetical protein
MVKQFLLIIGFLFSTQVMSQTGIGTTTPHASAKLEVASDKLGFLPPRIALTTTNSASPITSPATGLLIFNTSNAGSIPNQVTPGYYYWDGVNSKWVRLEDKADNFGNHTATDNIRLNGYFLSNDGGNEGIRVDNSGNVGIGTATPAVPLEVNGAVNASTLSLSNSTIGTSSLVLRNGNSASSFTDVPQIRMGWSGSATGKSQYAQIIHTRHNSGGTNNAIDFYLSNGTADNTIISGSTRAMTITSPGNVEITGKLSVGDPTGNVVSKASGLVDVGTFVQLDNIKATVIRNGNFGGLSLASVAGSFNCNIGGNFSGPAVGNSGTAGTTTITTAASTSIFGWGFPSQGDTSTYILTDTTNSRAYRIILQIGGSFLNNFISIERLF